MLFMRGLRKMPWYWQVWVLVLVLINGVGPCLFLQEKVAVVTLVAVLLGGILGEVLCHLQGFTKLLGLMHAPWVPMFVLQILVLSSGKADGLFAQWLWVSAGITFLSLVLDVLDVVQYLRGNRKDLLQE